MIDFNIFNCPRLTDTHGGGIAVIYKSSLPVIRYHETPFEASTFEIFEFTLLTKPKNIHVICIYRPNGSVKKFLEELDTLLSLRCTCIENILLLGDLNIHLDKHLDRNTKLFSEILDSFGLAQHVTEPTHQAGHILDPIVFSLGNMNSQIQNVVVTPMPVSDHYLITSSICNVHTSQSGLSEAVPFRKIKDVDLDQFCKDLNDQLPAVDDETCDSSKIDSAMLHVLNHHAPLKNKKQFVRKKDLWFNGDIAAARHARRRAERQYRRSKSAADKEVYYNAIHHVQHLIKEAKRIFYTNKFESSSQSPAELFKTFKLLTSSSIHNNMPTKFESSVLPDLFSDYFVSKIIDIRKNLDLVDQPSAITSEYHTNRTEITGLRSFAPTSVEELESILKDSNLKTSKLDPLPSVLLQRCLPTLLPLYVHIFNNCMLRGIFPSGMKQAVIRPLLKKSNLDPNVFSNYRPISNLSFVSKLFEKVISSRIHDHLYETNANPSYQSAYRS